MLQATSQHLCLFNKGMALPTSVRSRLPPSGRKGDPQCLSSADGESFSRRSTILRPKGRTRPDRLPGERQSRPSAPETRRSDGNETSLVPPELSASLEGGGCQRSLMASSSKALQTGVAAEAPSKAREKQIWARAPPERICHALSPRVPDMHHIPVLHHIFLAFQAQDPPASRCSL